jgi:hypothetical protein
LSDLLDAVSCGEFLASPRYFHDLQIKTYIDVICDLGGDSWDNILGTDLVSDGPVPRGNNQHMSRYCEQNSVLDLTRQCKA